MYEDRSYFFHEYSKDGQTRWKTEYGTRQLSQKIQFQPQNHSMAICYAAVLGYGAWRNPNEILAVHPDMSQFTRPLIVAGTEVDARACAIATNLEKLETRREIAGLSDFLGGTAVKKYEGKMHLVIAGNINSGTTEQDCFDIAALADKLLMPAGKIMMFTDTFGEYDDPEFDKNAKMIGDLLQGL